MIKRVLNGVLLALFLCATVFVTPSFAETSWKKNPTVIKSSQLKRAVTFKSASSGYGVGTKKVPSGTQGGTITEKYYVFAVHPCDNCKNSVYIANRSNGKIVKVFSEYWGHMNSFHYTWGTGHVIINSSNKGNASSNKSKIPNSSCIDVNSLKMLGNNYSSCKTKVARNWNIMSGLTAQGEAEYGDNVWVIAWNSSTDDNYIGVYKKSNKALVKSYKIPHNLAKGEAEDISIDGSTGDVYVNYNIHDSSGRIAYVKIDHSVFKDLTTPTKDDSGSKKTPSTPSNPSNPGGGNSNDKSGKQSGDNNSSDNSNSGSTQGNVNLAPDHEAKCATILSLWCDNAEADGKKSIRDIISFVIGTMSIGIAVLGTIGIIMCGYLIMTARDNQAQVSKAKKRLVEIVIGIVMWALAALLVHLILPTTDADVTKDLTGVNVTTVSEPS